MGTSWEDGVLGYSTKKGDRKTVYGTMLHHEKGRKRMNHLPVARITEALFRALVKGQVVLSAREPSGRTNGMTVGWGFVGNMWNEPYFVCAARPERYTWKGIKSGKRFTVNVLDGKYSEGLAYFGSASGYQEDKFAKGFFHLDESLSDFCAPIREAHILLDCEVTTANNIQPFYLPEEEINKFYTSSGGYHTMAYGKIIRVIQR